jgi:hypothetical protein
MSFAAHFAWVAVLSYLFARVLGRVDSAGQSWAWRNPPVAIVCWQAVGLAFGLSVIGFPIAIGVAPYGLGPGSGFQALLGNLFGGGRLPVDLGPTRLALIAVGLGIAAVLLGSTAHSLLGALRAQRRHRDLLTLVARDDPAAPGALVLDHPSAAAYCLPGARPQVVVSAGTLNLLNRTELAAVLSHERAHADERHDLVLLPFTALCRALPRLRWVHTARETVALLVEMRADDKARRLHADAPLAAALLRFAETGGRPVAPTGTPGCNGCGPPPRVPGSSIFSP